MAPIENAPRGKIEISLIRLQDPSRLDAPELIPSLIGDRPSQIDDRAEIVVAGVSPHDFSPQFAACDIRRGPRDDVILAGRIERGDEHGHCVLNLRREGRHTALPVG